jgi:hypothetical protein
MAVYSFDLARRNGPPMPRIDATQNMFRRSGHPPILAKLISAVRLRGNEGPSDGRESHDPQATRAHSKSHDRIPDVLVDRPFLPLDRLCYDLQLATDREI